MRESSSRQLQAVNFLIGGIQNLHQVHGFLAGLMEINTSWIRCKQAGHSTATMSAPVFLTLLILLVVILVAISGYKP